MTAHCLFETRCGHSKRHCALMVFVGQMPLKLRLLLAVSQRECLPCAVRVRATAVA